MILETTLVGHPSLSFSFILELSLFNLPYCSHWPNCNWCGAEAGSQHIATKSNGTHADQPPTDDPGPGNGNDYGDGDNGDDDSGDDDNDYGDDGDDGSNGDNSQSNSGSSGGVPVNIPPISRMVKRIRRFFGSNTSLDDIPNAVFNAAAGLPSISLPGGLPSPTTTSDRVVNGTPAAAENPVKTQTQKNKAAVTTTASKTTKTSEECTPSPTKSLAPSASKFTTPSLISEFSHC